MSRREFRGFRDGRGRNPFNPRFRNGRGRNPVNARGRGGGRVIEPPNPVLAYLQENDLDDEGQVQFNTAMYRHQEAESERLRRRVQCDNAAENVNLSNIERLRDEVRVRMTRAAIEKAQTALSDEEKQVQVAEATAAAEHRIRRRDY